MPNPSRLATRQASALLANHLLAMQTNGRDRIWLRPGIRLDPPTPRPRFVPAIQLRTPPPTGTPVDRAALLDALRAEAAAAPEPHELGTLRETFVFATGNPDADLMFIGEAPGAEEEARQEPFVGPAGQLLDRIIVAMGLQRRDVYISNIVKYRPKTGDAGQGKSNRKPNADELRVCLPIIQREIEIIRPKVIVSLGATAYAGLTGDQDVRVAQVRGVCQQLGDIPMIPTFHPAYLLRQSEPAATREKRKLWEDMMQVMEMLGMPISTKQRGFFNK